MEWDADDFEPPKPVSSDKWAGEDEEEAVKDSWEEEDDEKKEGTKEKEKTNEVTAYQRPKKKPLAERIAKKKKGEEEAQEQEKPKELTEEEKLAERLRLRKIQEDADLKLAMDAFGCKDGPSVDKMYPVTDEEFDSFKDALMRKIQPFSKEKYYPIFLDKLITELVMDLPSEDHKKISTNLSQLFHEKERLKKEQEKKKKKKQKAVVKVDRPDELGFGGEALDYDDFM